MNTKINYETINEAEILELISSGASVAELGDKLYNAGNMEGYEIVDQYAEMYGY